MAKRKGMPFQTRLTLTMLAIVVGVMIALMMASERKIKETYTAQFNQQKASIVEDLESSRADRSREFLDLCARIAKHPYVISRFNGEDPSALAREFWSDYSKSSLSLAAMPKGLLPGEKGRNQRASAEISSRLSYLTIVDKDLKLEEMRPPSVGSSNARKGTGRRTPFKSPRFREIAQQLLIDQKQTTLFIPMPTQNGTTHVQEVVATPVVDPDSDELLGLLLRGTSAEIQTRKALFGTGVFHGIYLADTLHAKSENNETLELATDEIANALAESPAERSLQFDAEIEDLSYRFHVDRLTEEDADPAAHQVIAFPLEQMESDLNELRIRGSGIGLGVLLVGWLASYLLARNLAIPLRELSKGTEAIRAGALDHRVTVRSRDEIGDLAESFNEMAEELKQKAVYRELLGKVSDESVAHALVSGSLDLELGGEMKEVSVLFCDIRGFTDLTQDMHPSEVIEFLNEHMSAMTEIVRRHYGVVDKFVGDEIMAVFGGLKSYGNDAGHAVACALEMIRERERLNRLLGETKEGSAKAGHAIEIGIGIATGEVIAGCMGSNDRLNYTVLGSRVNLAARLCGQAGRMEAVVDAPTAEARDSSVAIELIPDLRLKGFREVVPAYRIHPKASTDERETEEASLTDRQTASVLDTSKEA